MNRTERPNAFLMVFAGMLVALVVVVLARMAYGLLLPPMLGPK